MRYIIASVRPDCCTAWRGSNNKIAEKLMETARKKRIAFQVDVDYGYTSTDADHISQVRGGVPIGVLSVPTRYLHSSVETLSLKDVDLTAELLTQYIIQTKLNF